jgi:cyclic pyranopterin phosphate synthase
MTRLSHVDADGQAQMVDVSGKPETARRAVATGTIRMTSEALEAIQGNSLAKGDALGVARVAGIMAAKRTAELVPLCHQLPLTDVRVTLVPDSSIPGIRCEAEVQTVGRTGVEMEAIVAVSIALVTIYDMAKSADRQMTISDIALILKSGGKSGEWRRG